MVRRDWSVYTLGMSEQERVEVEPVEPAPDSAVQSALRVIDAEAEALRCLRRRIGEEFSRAVDLILACKGRVVTTGMGKAGFIASKVSATLASCGTPSIHLHPVEAVHGDLGRLVRGDILLAMSKSGETEELLRLLPSVKASGVDVIAMTESRSSTLGRLADLVLELGPINEAGSLGLAPTASTLAMLALGDALALVVQERSDFGPEEFARFHPGGQLGRSLMRVHEIMRKGNRNPLVRSGTTAFDTMAFYSNCPGRPGAALIVDDGGKLLGLFTDGDLRRHLRAGSSEFLHRSVDDVMTKNPKTVAPGKLAAEALAILKEHQVDQLPVVDEAGRAVGLLDVQDLLELKITL